MFAGNYFNDVPIRFNASLTSGVSLFPEQLSTSIILWWFPNSRSIAPGSRSRWKKLGICHQSIFLYAKRYTRDINRSPLNWIITHFVQEIQNAATSLAWGLTVTHSARVIPSAFDTTSTLLTFLEASDKGHVRLNKSFRKCASSKFPSKFLFHSLSENVCSTIPRWKQLFFT